MKQFENYSLPRILISKLAVGGIPTPPYICRQMAGAAVLLEEWLQELAALAQVILSLFLDFFSFSLLLGAQRSAPAGASSSSMINLPFPTLAPFPHLLSFTDRQVISSC